MVVLPDAGQGMARGERRGLLVSSWFWCLPHHDIVALGAGNPVLRLLGILWLSLSPRVLCPVGHYPCSRELRTRTVACTPAIWGDPAQPLALFEARRRLLALVPKQG